MTIPASANPLLLSTSAAGGYTIERSLRFNSADSAYLSKGFGSGSTTTSFTFSFWMKRGTVASVSQTLFDSGDGSVYGDMIRFNGETLDMYFKTPDANYNSIPVLRDPSAWYHVVIALGRPGTLLKTWINGTETYSADATGIVSRFGSANTHNIGCRGGSGARSTFSDIYLADIHFINGQALDPTSFGKFDANGVWQPKAYTGTYGTNGFHLPFSDNSTAAALGTDTSGNGNDWTVNNLVTSPYNYIAETSVQIDGAPDTATTPNMWDGLKTTYTYASSIDTSNYIKWQPSGGYNTPGYIWIQGGDGNGAGLDVSTVKINGTTVSHSAVVSNESYGVNFNWGKWWKYAVSGNTLNTLEIIGDYVLVRQLSTVADPTFSALGISDDNDVPALVSIPGAQNDSFVDTPTSYGEDTGAGGEVRGNYCTWNPLDITSGITLTNGNLDVTQTAGSGVVACATWGISSGKWYWEVQCPTGTNSMVGIGDSNVFPTSSRYYGGSGLYYYQSTGGLYGNLGHSGSNQPYGASFQNSTDIVGVALDMDNGNINFYKNGVDQGVANTSSLLGKTVTPTVNNGGATADNVINFGQRPFDYTAPSGYKALCTANLPDPDPVVAKPSTVMDVALDSGANILTATKALCGGNANFLWIKDRANGSTNHRLIDVLRDPQLDGTPFLASNSTSDEATLGTYSAPSGNSVGWAWYAGNSTVTYGPIGSGADVEGAQYSITSQVRANASAGFSIVTYTGTGSAATIGHGLGVAPQLIITKCRGASSSWGVYHVSTGATGYLRLDLPNTFSTGAGPWNNTAPTSTVFTVGTNPATNTANTMVAYCFAPVAGYSAFGSYTGNNITNGPFVYTGFRPRWILLKDTNTTGFMWNIYDAARNTYNVADTPLEPNTAASESGTTYPGLVDMLSNGFKIRSADATSYINRSTNTIIYAAFAGSPFKYSRAR